MRIITKYILKEQIAPFFVGFLFFTFIFLLQKLFRLASLLVEKKVPIDTVLKLMLYAIPFTMAITVPIGVLVSVIVSLGRLSGDSEIIAMRSGGISYLRIFKPLLISSFILSILMCIFNDTILIYSNVKFKKIYREILISRPVALLEERSFTQVLDNVNIWIGKKYPKSNRIENIVIIEKDYDGWIRIFAKVGYIRQNPKDKRFQSLVLYNASMGKSNDITGTYHEIKTLKKLIINIPITIITNQKLVRGPREMSFSELLKDILLRIKLHKGEKFTLKKVEELKLQDLIKGISILKFFFGTYSREINYRLLELFKKYAIPFSALAFTIIGAPLGVFSGRSGKTASFGIAISIIFLYYILLVLGQTFGQSGKISPFIASWGPNIILSILGIIAFHFRNDPDVITRYNPAILIEHLIKKLKQKNLLTSKN